MSGTQKMFVCVSCMLIAGLVFTQAVPVPTPEEIHTAEIGQFMSAQVKESEVEPASVQTIQYAVAEPVPAQVVETVADSVSAVEAVDPAVVRPVRSASPFFGILTGGFEKPYKSQQNHHHHYHQEEYDPVYHRPQYHKPQHYHHEEYEPETHKPKPQKPQHGSGAGSFASAGSFAGGQGGGQSQSQSAAHSHSASFGFGPFQASISSSSANSGSHHFSGGLSDYE